MQHKDIIIIKKVISEMQIYSNSRRMKCKREQFA